MEEETEDHGVRALLVLIPVLALFAMYLLGYLSAMLTVIGIGIAILPSSIRAVVADLRTMPTWKRIVTLATMFLTFYMVARGI